MTKLSDTYSIFDSYQKLITFYSENKDKRFDVVPLDLHTWFSATMCSALGGVLDILSANLNEIEIRHIDTDVKSLLLQNDFLLYYGHQRKSEDLQSAIRFLKLKPTDGKYFNKYIFNELIGNTELPPLAKESMAQAIYEIFVNAQIHSESPNIYTCGQFIPQDNTVEFTIADIGIGFKNKVNRRFNSNLTSIQAITWAIQDRHTTKENITGGIGLAILKEFVAKNKGKMQIISDDGFYQYDTTGEQTRLFAGYYPGTIVNLQFKTDDHSLYHLCSEPVDIF